MVGELCLDRLLVIILATKEIFMNFTLSCKCNAGPVQPSLYRSRRGKCMRFRARSTYATTKKIIYPLSKTRFTPWPWLLFELLDKCLLREASGNCAIVQTSLLRVPPLVHAGDHKTITLRLNFVPWTSQTATHPIYTAQISEQI